MITEQGSVHPESLVKSATRSVLGPHRFLSIVALGFSVSFSGPVAGCGDPDLPAGITKKAVALDEVPAALRVAARKALPKVDFKEAWQNLDSQGKLHSFEIRGRQPSDGKIREVRVSLKGNILEAE